VKAPNHLFTIFCSSIEGIRYARGMDILLYLAAISFFLVALISIETAYGMRQIWQLKETEPTDEELPSISLIFSALNEEDRIELALKSMLSLDYDNLEILAVNDRSTDNTGPIMECLAEQNPRLKVIHISELPKGWLGKNHALFYASQYARGEWLVFADADVEMEPSTLKRVMTYALEHHRDHISLLPDVAPPSGVLRMMILESIINLFAYLKPWKAKDENSKRFMGVGAFNLVKASVYQAIGTHKAFAMQPIDDIMLGKKIKRHGFRQELVSSSGLISLPWYTSVSDMVQGLEKNTFALTNYNILLVILATIAQILLYIWPLFALFLTSGMIMYLNVAVLVARFASFLDTALLHKMPVRHLVWAPISPYLELYILWNSALTTLINGGINWRGTHYPLKELKRYRI
jgi:glycosyltransferase involved in cell wall biosynthesis